MTTANQKKKIRSLEDFIRSKVSAAGKTGGVVGLSGGIDSAVCMYLAAGALGPGNTHALFMPHRKEQSVSENDLRSLCGSLGINFGVYNLEEMITLFKNQTGTEDRILIGNFSARLRAAYLYQHAAKTNSLVVNTGNRSEIMLGYCTKWGDQAGDISPIANLYKRQVYELAEALGIPESIMKARPSAGFYEGQEDEKEIGMSYAELDDILEKMAAGREEKIDKIKLDRVREKIKLSEHKRSLPYAPPE
ncbi:MAG: NAD+ synthase [Elusimicrobia bacterium]|nr:NAD+ synthase [Elusimicrobiota bacterium]